MSGFLSYIRTAVSNLLNKLFGLQTIQNLNISTSMLNSHLTNKALWYLLLENTISAENEIFICFFCFYFIKFCFHCWCMRNFIAHTSVHMQVWEHVHRHTHTYTLWYVDRYTYAYIDAYTYINIYALCKVFV